MNNVWTVAFKTPCTGLRVSSNTSRRILAPIVAIGNARWVSSAAGWNTLNSSCVHKPTPRSPIDTRLFNNLRRNFSTTIHRGAAKKAKAKAKTESPTPKKTKPPATPKKPAPDVNNGTASEVAQVQLSASQVESILGPGLTFDKGMQVLQDLQFRRVTGSLADQGITFPEDIEITPDHATRGLLWLRENYPADEEAAAAEWAEEEAERLEAQYTKRAEELWLYKKTDDEPEVQQIQQHDEGGLYGQSVLEQHQKEVKAQQEAEEAALEKEQADNPAEPYKGHDVIVRQKAELGMIYINPCQKILD
jgi:rhomboid-like protein